MEDETNINREKFFELIQKNHGILRNFGLSHPELERLVKLGTSKGWTGKITGSGMGGCILLLAEKGKG